jgi:K+-transporting ATPase ATPase A chain
MTLAGAIEILVFFAIVVALTPLLGRYLYRVFEAGRPPLGRVGRAIERAVLRLIGVDPAGDEQTWRQYAGALLAFSLVTLLATYAILRLQGRLGANPQGFGAVEEWLALDTAVSFTTNTNWQNYAGETTLSYLSQALGLAWHNFISAAAGIATALVVARGITRRKVGAAGVGNFWVDLVRGTLWVFLPISLVGAIALVAMGVPQTLERYPQATTVEGATQAIAVGPVASQEVIKELGTNGGGFMNANSAHPFENPTPLSNFLEVLLIFVIPAGLIYMYGLMAGDTRQGWALFGACAILFFAGVATCAWAEARPNPALAGLAIDQSAGNMEGKEVRFGIAASALFATVTTDTSCGAVNSMHDSFTPLGGLVPLANLHLGEVVFGGVGAGLYALLVMALLSVFIAGLMVGRTPELCGKKVESGEVKLAMLYVLIYPAIILGLTAWTAVKEYALMGQGDPPLGLSHLGNAGPHGLSEILYAFSSCAANNGSAFGGLGASTPFWNGALAVAMLFGRFLMKVPALAIGGALVGKRHSPPGLGTFPTNGATFAVLLVAVIVIVGALTFFPALALGPIVEHFAAGAGKLF